MVDGMLHDRVGVILSGYQSDVLRDLKSGY
jgi:hypothetical protein